MKCFDALFTTQKKPPALCKEMHMKRISDEMLEHTINMLACLSFMWLKDFERFGLQHILLPTTIFVRNGPKTWVSS